MYQGLALTRSHPDALVLQHAPEAAHSVPLEVGEVDEKVVVGHVATHTVEAQVGGVGHGNVDTALFVH